MTELDEVKFHLFLEKRGETQTIVEVRDKMRTIDLDSNLQISFMEYCLFKYDFPLFHFSWTPSFLRPDH